MPDETALPAATIRATPADFRVEELPLYEPSGAGEHLYVTFEKRGLTTLEAVARLARTLGVAPRDVGTAGLKDKHAVTTQVASFSFALARHLPAPGALDSEGLRVLSVSRHGNKLRTGHLAGNRFSIVLRDLEAGAAARVAEGLEALGARGLPNRFGEQRFGHAGDNARAAQQWMAGERPVPRDPKVRRLQFSALQSELFHAVLDRRVADGTWDTPLEGDLVEPRAGGGLTRFHGGLAASGNEAAEAWVATGPMFGSKMRWPEGDPLALEREVHDRAFGDGEVLRRFSVLGEGARRPLKLWPTELQVSELDEAGGSLRVDFVLPRGAYATSVLSAVCAVRDAARVQPEPITRIAHAPAKGALLESTTQHRESE